MIISEQVPVAGTAVVCRVPPGACTITFVGAPSGGGTVYLGMSTAVTATTGVPVYPGAIIPIPGGFATSNGTTIYGVPSSGTVSIGYFLATDN